MKTLLITLLILLSPKPNTYLQTDIEEKILGQWILDRTKSAGQSPDGASADPASAPTEKIAVYFKSDNTGNFNFADKDSEKFTWSINKNRIAIKYSGNNGLCKSFNNDFKIILRDRKGIQKLELIRNDLSLSLSR